MMSCRFLFTNGVVSYSSDAPPVSTFLETHPGAYTTTRTHSNCSSLLLWERHLHRLADSAKILLDSNPELFFGFKSSRFLLSADAIRLSRWKKMIKCLISNSMSKVLPIALKGRKAGEELAITAVLCGDLEKMSGIVNLDDENISKALDVYVHVGVYLPPVFGIRENGANVALVGRGRSIACAKHTKWVRLRKPLEKLRPPLATELLLSNDGDRILEGSVTNFFVVCRMDSNVHSNEAKGTYLLDYRSTCRYEVQTAPVKDGVLPGIIRQLVTEVCSSKGIPLREVAPSWSKRDFWEEAFLTNSLRVVQHVETIRVPTSWESLESKTWKDVTWDEKQFEEGPGMITAIIQKEIMSKAGLEGFPVSDLV